MASTNRSIPGYFNKLCQDVPFTMLLKGKPGTGKTIFALELSESLENVLYINTRYNPSGFFKEYPWTPKENITVESLDEIIDGGSVDYSSFDLIILDTWQGMTDDESTKDFSRAILDALKAKPTSIICIHEGGSVSALDYIVDTVVVLGDIIVDERSIRKLEIQKSRGRALLNKRHYFTLKGGRFVACRPLSDVVIEDVESWDSPPEDAGFFSTGSRTFDAITGGGFKIGTFNIIELRSTTANAIDILLLSPIINFINRRRGVIVSSITPAKEAKAAIMLFCDPEIFNRRIKFLDEKLDMHVDIRQYIYQLNNRERDLFKAFPEVYDDLSKETNYAPILSVMEYNPLDYDDPVMLRKIVKHIKFIKSSNSIELAIIQEPSPSNASSREREIFKNFIFMADNWLKIHSLDDITFLTGMKPYTKHYSINIETGKTLTLNLKEIL
ncbi:MAG: RAD55 family ATPase [Promethearchaeota archaeon]